LFHENRKSLTWKNASYLSIEQQRRRDTNSTLPQERYELAVLRHRLTDNDTKQEIACRVIFVFSTADQKVVRKQRQKQIDKIQKDLQKIQKTVARGAAYSDESAVAKRLSKRVSGKSAAKYFSWTMTEYTAAQQKKLPKPGRGCRTPTHRFEFTFDPQAVVEDEEDDGYSAVVTTVPQNRSSSSADVLFTKFKQQIYSEQVNARFKGPLAVRPVFLHTPERVEALVCLMIAVLMLDFLLQRMYRQSLPEDASTKEQRTTTRTILQAFASYTLLIHYTRFGRVVRPTRLTARQREILNRLGFKPPAQILSKRLPRPPT